MSILSGTELDTAVNTLPGWKLDAGQLTQEWTFGDFPAAIHFVNQVAPLAEQAGHHPGTPLPGLSRCGRDHPAGHFYGKTYIRAPEILKG
jgi:hypothetical protein